MPIVFVPRCLYWFELRCLSCLASIAYSCWASVAYVHSMHSKTNAGNIFFSWVIRNPHHKQKPDLPYIPCSAPRTTLKRSRSSFASGRRFFCFLRTSGWLWCTTIVAGKAAHMVCYMVYAQRVQKPWNYYLLYGPYGPHIGPSLHKQIICDIFIP
jgi:hypothetical protein